MLVGVPIGLYVWTLIADFVYVLSDEAVWYDIAFWSGLAAWVSAGAAAIPGVVDYVFVASRTEARLLATAHMFFNVTVLALYAAASLIMWDHGALAGRELTAVVILHTAGAGLLALAGWLGGEMVFRHRIGVLSEADVEDMAAVRRAGGDRGRFVHRGT
jgi:uncharacterized membrane protein